jgi:hypothetical protein
MAALRNEALAMGIPLPPPQVPVAVAQGPVVQGPIGPQLGLGVNRALLDGFPQLAAHGVYAPPVFPAALVGNANLDTIVHFMRTTPPRLLADSQGGRFAVDTEGAVFAVFNPAPSEEYLSVDPHVDDARWLRYTGMQATMGSTAEKRKIKPIFDSLLWSVRTLEKCQKLLLLSDEGVVHYEGVAVALTGLCFHARTV